MSPVFVQSLELAAAGSASVYRNLFAETDNCFRFMDDISAGNFQLPNGIPPLCITGVILVTSNFGHKRWKRAWLQGKQDLYNIQKTLVFVIPALQSISGNDILIFQ